MNDVVVLEKDVKEITENMPSEISMERSAQLYKVLGDYTRIRILCALAVSPMRVCLIAQALDMTQSAISHQLRILKNARLVVFRREGKSMVYALADQHVRTLIESAVEHIEE